MLPPDPTLDEIRAALAPLVADNAAFDGWNAKAVESAAGALGLEKSIAAIAFLGGVAEMIDAWFASIDVALAARFTPEQLGNMKIRDRITRLVETRLELVAGNREALRRAVAILAMPQNIAHATKLGWRSADVMWRLAGDTATDYNHYTKRAILGSVYAATVTVFLNDESEGWAATHAFLGRRIEGIMAFEKAKAKWLGRDSHRLSLSRFIGRLRYPAV
ncbi:MAG TPA: COQ9 family protein [Sphingomonas sp.]|nr:COQ9 family protein [Sphingomonas sp.]